MRAVRAVREEDNKSDVLGPPQDTDPWSMKGLWEIIVKEGR
jgi:hypothetical protein